MSATHPPYEKMIKAAIVSLKERTGSSQPAIAKYLKANYTLPDTFTKALSKALKKCADDGKLVKVKASYKLGSLKAEPKKPKKKKTVAKKKVTKKTTAPKKKAAPKKTKAPKKKAIKKKKK